MGGGGGGGATEYISAWRDFDKFAAGTREPVTTMESAAASWAAGSGGDATFVSIPDPAQEASNMIPNAKPKERCWLPI
jgi:hypothetical protein